MRDASNEMEDRKYLAETIALAADSAGSGGFPNGAIVVLAGEVVGEGVSRSRLNRDPTAHAEVEALRAAAADSGTGRLPGAVLYSALEPCLMCLHAAYWAGIARIVYGAGKEHFRGNYYEGQGGSVPAVRAMNRKLRLEFLPGLEERIISLVWDWERNKKPEGGK